MGKNISKQLFQQQEFTLFQQRLYQQLEQLKAIMTQSNFGKEPLKMGAELEMYLVDNQGEISLNNMLLLSKLNDPQFQPELNQYNLELNLNPVALNGRPFSNLRAEILTKTGYLEKVAHKEHINIVPIGILPTLHKTHLNSQYMTDLDRYHCLAKGIYQQRGEDFKININGDESLSVNFSDISAEGANTSFQVHLMVANDQLTNTFNSAQLTAPLVAAISANSGIFLGKSLWHETRIALFKQSLDIRLAKDLHWQAPPRVNFGHGWVRRSIWELFAEAVALYPVIIPEINRTAKNKEDANDPLHELSLHLGTIWPWHRPVYDPHGNGHIRIEFRAIPAGPTSIDMLANAAFAIGLATGLANNIEQYLVKMPFRYAEYNFYRAAQSGLNANILWPCANSYQIVETPIINIIEQLMPLAKQGLASLNIQPDEIALFLGVIEQRISQGITGAIWQKNTLAHYQQTMNRQQACQRLVQNYIANSRTCQPVATWERPWT